MALTAKEELAAKLKLELALKRKLLATYAQLSRMLRAGLKIGIVPDLRGTALPGVTLGYRSHYDRVARVFGGLTNDELPEDLQMTEDESAIAQAALADDFDDRAYRAATGSLTTLQANATKAKVRADRLISEDQTGKLKPSDAPRLAQQIFMKRQRPNAATSARMETQFAAEATKGVEVSVLTQEIEPKLLGSPFKTWRSQGDSRVRTPPKSHFDHLGADGLRVRTNVPFVVNNEMLMWPGDQSFGATMGNIANCRCSAIYDVPSVEELRRVVLGRGPDLVPDAPFPFPITESDEVVSIPMNI